MLKLARWSTTHRTYVLIAWLVLLIGVNVVPQSAGTSYSNNFTIPNSEAQRAADLLAQSFPAQAGDRDQIVYPADGRIAFATVVFDEKANQLPVARLNIEGTTLTPPAPADSGDGFPPTRRPHAGVVAEGADG